MKPCKTFEGRLDRINKRLTEATNPKTVAKLIKQIIFLTKLHIKGLL